MTLFEEIGEEKIAIVIEKFYDKAFSDGIIGHFFFNKSKSELIRKQTDFASAMLGSKKHTYTGRPIKTIHHALPLRHPHFDRRQKILEETLYEQEVVSEHAEKWLALEERLRSQIVP